MDIETGGIPIGSINISEDANYDDDEEPEYIMINTPVNTIIEKPNPKTGDLEQYANTQNNGLFLLFPGILALLYMLVSKKKPDYDLPS